MNRALTLVCTALLALGACKDGGTPTVPKENADLIVHISAAPSPPTMEGGFITCVFTVQALATGDLAARADWTGGKVRSYLQGETAPADSMPIEGRQLQEVFGGPFSPLLSSAALLTVSAPTPFSVEIDVSYRVQNTDARRTASTRSNCGMPA